MSNTNYQPYNTNIATDYAVPTTMVDTAIDTALATLEDTTPSTLDDRTWNLIQADVKKLVVHAARNMAPEDMPVIILTEVAA